MLLPRGISSSEILQVPDAVKHQEVAAVRKGETEEFKDSASAVVGDGPAAIRKPRPVLSLPQ